MAAETTIRVTRTTREALNRIAQERGVTTATLVGELAARESELEELRGWMEDFASKSPEEAAAYRRDFADWQGWEVSDDASAAG